MQVVPERDPFPNTMTAGCRVDVVCPRSHQLLANNETHMIVVPPVFALGLVEDRDEVPPGFAK